MNQAFLLNDDLSFNGESWQLTGLASGQLITITVYCSQTEYSDSLKFDIEMAIEDWLEKNEPEDISAIELSL